MTRISADFYKTICQNLKNLRHLCVIKKLILKRNVRPKKTISREKRLAQLKRIGVRKGTRHIAMPPPKPRPTEAIPTTEPIPLHFLNYQDDLQHAAPIEAVVPGVVVENAHGQYFRVDARYPLAAKYGNFPLKNLLDVPMETVAAITDDDRWLDLSWRDVLFFDTETTGLEIAAGTVAFLIGVGFIEGDDFVVRQVFMRDFNEEMALLADLHNLCQNFRAAVSFNGKTFDVPMLENRFTLARLFVDLFDDAPHFDLLHPSRRVWRHRLENCKLGTLETDVLGVTRTHADVPGYFIPTLYRKYLVDGDARPMAGIFYHNEMDIVSMAALAAVLGQVAAFPNHSPEIEPLHPVDLAALGLWHHSLGRIEAAEAALKTALASDNLPTELRRRVMTDLAFLHKRCGRGTDAESLWQELVAAEDSLLALEELAKFYEWQQKDIEKARTCTEYALKILKARPADWRIDETIAVWEHRLARLKRKQVTAE